jgi:hypothetical protein
MVAWKWTQPVSLGRTSVSGGLRDLIIRVGAEHGQVAAAIRGRLGDVQFTGRTGGSTLFVNLLRTLYFTFDLDILAK